MRTVAILPVKGFANAKQRLALGISPDQRRSLAEAMFRDVMTALCESASVDEVLVISRGATARQIAAEYGAQVLGDEERGHNAAALVGIRAALDREADRVVLVPGDCPALDPSQLDGL